MTVLQIEHKVPSYDGWKKAFDSDPIGRENRELKAIAFIARKMTTIM